MHSSHIGLITVAYVLLSERSVTRAAGRLHLSVSATSRALDRCRDAFGDPLLVRSGRGLAITPGGEELLARLEPLVADIESLFDRGEVFSPGDLDATFTIRSGEVVVALMGATLTGIVRELAPGVGLRFEFEGPEDIPDLRSGDVSLAIGSYGDLTGDINSEPLGVEALVGVLDPRHALAGRRMTAARFAGLEHIDVSRFGRPRRSVDQLLAKEGRSRQVSMVVPSFSAALLACIDSDRTALVPGRLAAKLVAAGAISTYEPPIPLPAVNVSQVWHARNDSDPAHGWLRSCVRRAFSLATGET